MSNVINAIPNMKPKDMINLWRNAIGYLNDGYKKPKHNEARQIIRAINNEWARRYSIPDLREDGFRWPSTVAVDGNGQLSTDDWERDGVLKFMGYRVGDNGEADGIRELILKEVFEGQIPPVFPKHYLQQWGSPGSVRRLMKIAETIAAFTRNAKRRRDSSLDAAIRDWELDLEYLRSRYYQGVFRFSWPVCDT